MAAQQQQPVVMQGLPHNQLLHPSPHPLPPSPSQFFRSHFTVGAKASFIMLPVFYSFWWASEKSVARCSQDGSKARFRKLLGISKQGAAAADSSEA
jgi:hypothetical protein